MEKLIKSQNLLVLIGLICQAMSWEHYEEVTILVILLWFIALSLYREKKQIPDTLQFTVLLCGLIFFYVTIGSNIFEKCISLGNGLALLQIMRLSFPLNYREKLLCTAIAVTQIVIGTQVFLGYSFAVVIIMTLILLPKCLYTAQQTRFLDIEGFKETTFNINERKTEILIILSCSFLFFLFFPRVNLDSRSTFYAPFGTYRDSLYLSKPELDSSLKSLNKNIAANTEVVLQMYTKGKKTKYLKTMGLDRYKNGFWDISNSGYARIYKLNKSNYSTDNYRKIDIKSNRFDSKFLPVDGQVLKLNGNFFNNPYFTRNWDVIVDNIISKNKKTYEYWTSHKNIKLRSRDIKRFSSIDGVSDKLINFVNSYAIKEKSQYENALKLEAYLKDNFKYKLGAPELNRQAPVEDFIFTSREGHCERFASALSILLRIMGVPTQVAIGYMVRDYNQFGGYYNIRANDLHAWTQAYFEGRGWVDLDATPAAEFESNIKQISPIKRVADYIEYIWYSKVINLTFGDQVNLISEILIVLHAIVNLIFEYIYFILLVLALVSILIFLYTKARFKIIASSRLFSLISRKGNKLRYANHFYGKMLMILKKQGYVRRSSETPLEFLKRVKAANHSKSIAVEFVTNKFIKFKYGMIKPELSEAEDIEKNIIELKKNKHS